MEPGSTLGNGRYVLTELVGVGGVGEVWRATDAVLERTVAVKVLRHSLVEEFGAVRRFAAEARVMARLDHRGIAAVYDFGHDADDTAYLVMRYVAGEPLRRIMDRTGIVPPDRLLPILVQAADALDAAHDAGVIHRDVKPGNLLVRADGSVVLTDFGIARAAGGADLTGAGMVVGTARYIAPEQATAAEITSAVDVYSLGVTAYECLTGRVPFDGDSPIDIARQHVESPVPRLPASVPETLRDLVNQMLAKRAPARPTAAEVASAGRDALAELQATAYAAEQVPVRQRRAMALGATGLAAGVIAAALIAFGPNGSGVDPAAGGLRVGVNSGIGGDASVAPASPSAGPTAVPVVVVTTAPTAGAPTTTRSRRGSSPTPKPSVSTPKTGGSPTVPGGPATSTEPSTPPSTQPPPPVMVTLINLVGQTENEAVTWLESHGFVPAIVRTTGPACLVVAQDPPPGDYPEQTLVTITLEWDDVVCAPPTP